MKDFDKFDIIEEIKDECIYDGALEQMDFEISILRIRVNELIAVVNKLLSSKEQK